MPSVGFNSTNIKQLLYNHPNRRKKNFTVRVIIHWNNLHRGMEVLPPLEVFQLWLDGVLDNLIKAPFPQKILDQMIFRVPFQPGLFHDSMIHINTSPSKPDSFMVLSRWKDWKISFLRSDWGSWGCLTWRKGGSGETWSLSTTAWKKAAWR